LHERYASTRDIESYVFEYVFSGYGKCEAIQRKNSLTHETALLPMI